MTVTIIWLLGFAAILFFSLRGWEASLSPFLARVLPEALRSDSDDRWVWCPAVAVLGATFLVRPVDMLLTLLVIALVAWGAKRLLCWAMKKAKSH
ncbi:hypothetical protein IEI94_07980 [Halomonas sp. ML-15]|uniref:hypothetical protein n=1 Tax=Halomonas sp. ML-15 TaxID=2773305 RepID=UPI00174699AB|nr:hypothetical protein [Halomonas sp. ML-15]MBD3895790.1 hypothetical protein [Halomonas sp. ML-15]